MNKLFKIVLCCLMASCLLACSNKSSDTDAYNSFVDSIPAKMVSSDNIVVNQLFDDKKKAGFSDEIYEWTLPSLKEYKKHLEDSEKYYEELTS